MAITKGSKRRRPQTNVEFVKELMEFGNPMKQLFILDAIGKMAKVVAEMPIEKLREEFGENAFVNPDAWQVAAKEIHKKLEERSL